ncbi:MAG: hypothetical protein DRN11_04325 [Thermoplasmata archaeon]|nr:MAG: hypothetical protein DRN11_04325 [Thermoplasmata archaeon]
MKREKKMSKYSTISIPKELHEEIEELITKNPELGYTSVAELCKEAIRLRLSEIKMEQQENYLSQEEVEELLMMIEKSLRKRK